MGLQYSPNGKRLVTGSFDEEIRQWNSETGKPIGKPFKGPKTELLKAVSYSPDGKIIAIGGWYGDPSVHLLDAETGEKVKKLYGHDEGIFELVFTPNGKNIGMKLILNFKNYSISFIYYYILSFREKSYVYINLTF